MKEVRKNYALVLLRITLGLIFLWAFFDKLLGLGFATSPERSWINGGSPTFGFLSKAVHGPLTDFYHALAPSQIVAWLFMLGILFIGISCTFGIATRLGSIAGAALSLLMWSALLPPANHPFLDEHIVYLFAFLAIAFSESRIWSLSEIGFLRKYKLLK